MPAQRPANQAVNLRHYDVQQYQQPPQPVFNNSEPFRVSKRKYFLFYIFKPYVQQPPPHPFLNPDNWMEHYLREDAPAADLNVHNNMVFLNFLDFISLKIF
jgi:hypothetical protein